MASEAAILGVLRSLQGMAQANAEAFRRYPAMAGAYRHALASGRFRYVSDQETCGLPDCWSTMRALFERYPIGPIPGDCEDFACGHAGYLASQGKRALIGLRPGKRIAHAVCALEGPGGTDTKIGAPQTVIDPSLDFGMPPLVRYDQIYWMRV